MAAVLQVAPASAIKAQTGSDILTPRQIYELPARDTLRRPGQKALGWQGRVFSHRVLRLRNLNERIFTCAENRMPQAPLLEFT
jgi:hypothetical protein